MAVLEDTALAEFVENVSEIVAPVVLKALQAAPQAEPLTDWPSIARGYKVPAELTHSGQRVLLMTAARGFGPKLGVRVELGEWILELGECAKGFSSS